MKHPLYGYRLMIGIEPAHGGFTIHYLDPLDYMHPWYSIYKLPRFEFLTFNIQFNPYIYIYKSLIRKKYKRKKKQKKIILGATPTLLIEQKIDNCPLFFFFSKARIH